MERENKESSIRTQIHVYGICMYVCNYVGAVLIIKRRVEDRGKREEGGGSVYSSFLLGVGCASMKEERDAKFSHRKKDQRSAK